MKFFIKLLLIFTFCTHAAFAASSYTKREYDVETKDGFLIKAYLTYPKTKLKTYPTIVILHSLGYSTQYWEDFPGMLTEKGYAVLCIDLRGHGKSVYNNKFQKTSWIYFKDDSFVKYPNDVLQTIEYVKTQTKKASFENWGIIGADIGANTAVLVAQASKIKPAFLTLISPSMSFKGLYIPVAMTEIGKTPILAISSKTDTGSMNEQAKLAKFAQGMFFVYNTESGGGGILLVKVYPEVKKLIESWCLRYLPPALPEIAE